jgi:hypothetical protein
MQNLTRISKRNGFMKSKSHFVSSVGTFSSSYAVFCHPSSMNRHFGRQPPSEKLHKNGKRFYM